MKVMSEGGPAVSDSFKPLRIVLSAMLLLLAISFFARWYGQQVSMPRYCEDPSQTLVYLKQIITEARPAGNASRRPYIVAAKLLFLIPQKSDEPLDVYLKRVRVQLQRECR